MWFEFLIKAITLFEIAIEIVLSLYLSVGHKMDVPVLSRYISQKLAVLPPPPPPSLSEIREVWSQILIHCINYLIKADSPPRDTCNQLPSGFLPRKCVHKEIMQCLTKTEINSFSKEKLASWNSLINVAVISIHNFMYGNDFDTLKWITISSLGDLPSISCSSTPIW